MTHTHPLATAIADLESRRATLGDAVVEAAIAALRAQLAAADAPPPAPAAAAPAASGAKAAGSQPRLRQVSILFVDIAGSTALLRGASADEALALLSPALERFAAVVRQAGGDVLRFTGDGLKAAFGLHGLREDDAEQAVRAGLGILQAAQAHAHGLQASHGVADFGVRVGVHTGPVLLGAGVEADRSAMGHAVHLAARIEQSAPVGRLRISHETWAQVRGLFRVEPQPPLWVKGHDEPLTTYVVLGANTDPERAPQRGVDGVAPPMIGRDAELATLLALFDQVGATQRPAVAWVVAQAGVGKTRLRHELLRALQAQAGPLGVVQLLQARAHPAAALQPYGLLRQLLTRWLSIADDLDADTARPRLVDGIVARLAGADDMPPDEAAVRAERLGHLLGLDFGHRPGVQALGARELREQGLAVLAALLTAQARPAPLVIVLDDLHWADAASVELVHRLVAMPTLPALWLLLTRPGAAAPAPPGAHTLRLDPLPPAQGAQLADALLAPLDAPAPALRELLIRRAEGNPFYMEELLRMLIDDGVIDARGRPWTLRARRLDTLRVPETLVGVLQARLDALPAAELAALQQASIVGPVFWDAALAELDAQAPAELPALRRRAAVVAREHSAFAQAGEFAFHHQLLHDVTYGTVLTPQRRAGHARAAQWLSERIAGREGEFLAMAADHFERAGDSARALECYDRARTEASSRLAHESTLHLIERALAQPALTDPRWRFQLLTSRHTALHHQSRDDEARATLQALAELAEQHDDDAMRADVAVSRMLPADHEGRPDEARALAQQALALAARSGHASASGAAALAHGELAWLALQQHDFATVEQQLALGIAQARVCATLPSRAGGYPGYELQLRVIRIDALQRQERHVDCLNAVAEALDGLGRRPYPHDRFHLLLLRCNGELNLGRNDAAAQTADAMRALARAIQMPRLESVALQQQAAVALRRDELATAQACAEQAEQLARAVAHDSGLPLCWWRLGEVAQRRGQPAAALAQWDQALALLQRQQRLQEALHLRCLRAALLPPGAALAELQAVLDEAAADRRAHWCALPPEALRYAWRLLADAGDARAPALHQALQARLQQQLAQLDADGRVQLLQGVPWWRALGVLPAADAA